MFSLNFLCDSIFGTKQSRKYIKFKNSRTSKSTSYTCRRYSEANKHLCFYTQVLLHIVHILKISCRYASIILITWKLYFLQKDRNHNFFRKINSVISTVSMISVITCHNMNPSAEHLWSYMVWVLAFYYFISRAGEWCARKQNLETLDIKVFQFPWTYHSYITLFIFDV